MTKPGVRDVEACELCALSVLLTAVIKPSQVNNFDKVEAFHPNLR